ncbi:phage tail sheath subtilisin-like domain-containing protein [Janthinobacterium fluminis]|uniref:Phage tail sheath subtilisin-like domain-containing protein n=1 Tax=Janthinobacterium fluminis TaxID=2987524 RepID=A0ABT5JXY9_9BURK|nr:phage tail sheath subtilisin-like domain-containing protein [Janthinobacterium fluminis]MDC8757018.1 phage tail sheath subtilisin-like domain-containing protein [Janthinobacterium fluminis]
MPSTLSYPGVYIEEIPSGVRTITSVATSVCAFPGRALRGPTDEAVVINSYGDFERIFGGLWVESSLGFAVRDFYLNGGSQAIIVRLFHANPADAAAVPPVPNKTPLSVGNFTFEAAYEGSWGGNLRFTLDAVVSDQVALQMGVPKNALFNLTVREVDANGMPVQIEQFRNLTIVPSSRQVHKVLSIESRLLRWKGVWPPGSAPDVAAIHTAELELADALKVLAAAKSAQPPSQPAIDAAQAVVNTKTKALADASTDNITRAEQKLAAALKANPPVPNDITVARDELAAAKKTSNGSALVLDDFTGPGKQNAKKGLYALRKADLFNILCLPPYLADGNVDVALVSEAASYCEQRRAMLLVDPPAAWNDKDAAKAGVSGVGTNSKNAALFFPRLKQPNPLHDNQPEDFVPCGAVAGVFARTDTTRGVWKAPAGLDATLVGVPQLSVPLTDAENGELNPLGINCLRAMPAAGRIVWGARTLQGDDRLASEWKYIPVRRTALFIEESLYRGTQWVVFEPNDEPLWAQIRLNLGAFMQNLFRQGAFQGKTPQEAYFVKCDKETTTQTDINSGIVNIVVGFAPLKPAEFVVIKLQQIAGQIQT